MNPQVHSKNKSRRSPSARTVSSRGNDRRTTKRRQRKDGAFTHTLKQVVIRLCVVLVAGLIGYLAYVYVFAPFRSKWVARYGNEIYPQGYSIRGIDVSHHQGNIDWEKLSRGTIGKEGISFVFIKATEGSDFMDENFNENFYEARDNGMIRGAYHYFKPGISAKVQADYFMKQVHLEPGDLPPVLDIEERGELSVKELQRAAKVWLDALEKRYGVKPILYTNYKFKESYLNTEAFAAYPYWIAHYYVQKLAYKGTWKFWQHTDCGKVYGIKGNVDLNIYNGSMYDLKRLCIPDEDD